MVVLGALLAAWGMSLVARARPARRHRRGRCADCNHRLPGSRARAARAGRHKSAAALSGAISAMPVAGRIDLDQINRSPQPAQSPAKLGGSPDPVSDSADPLSDLSEPPDLPASLAPPSPCPRCTSDTSRHALADLNHSARWTIPGLIIIALGLTCPWWSLPLLGAATGTSALLAPTLGLMSGTAVVLSGLAITLFVAGFLGDPSVGRPRCRRCWYPISPTTPATCPECGRVATTLAHLYRTRRRRAPMALGLVVLSLAQVGWFEPYIRRNGLVSLVPTNILINSIGIVPSDWITKPPLTQAQVQAQAAALNGGLTFYTPAGSTTLSANGTVISGNTYGGFAIPNPTSGRVIINQSNFFTSVPTSDPDHTLTGRIKQRQLTAEQLRRVRAVASSRVASSHSINSMQATLDLIHLATITPPASPGAQLANNQPTQPWPMNSWPRGPQGSTPELDAAYASALTVVIRELGGSDERAAAALAWVLAKASNLAPIHRRPRLASPECAESLAASAGDLERLAASPRDSTAAGAIMLLAITGRAGPDRLPRLTQILASTDPVAVDAAEMAIGAIALRSPEARALGAPVRPAAATASTNGTSELMGGYEIGDLVYDGSANAMPSPVAYSLGAGWRAWLAPHEAAEALITLDRSGRFSIWHQWAFLRSLARAEPAFLNDLVEFALANPDSTKAIAVFNGLENARFAHLDRWPRLLRAEHSAYAQNSVLELLYAATVKEPATVVAHRALLIEFADAMQRRIESDPSIDPGDHRYNGLARARALIEWIDEQPARETDPE